MINYIIISNMNCTLWKLSTNCLAVFWFGGAWSLLPVNTSTVAFFVLPSVDITAMS